MEKRTYYNEGNPNNITRAALFIFFMRTCYNGIYSVNHSGKLSVTFGAGGRVKLLEEELIRFNHKLLQDVVILDGDYRQTAEYTGANSLFYFDPPYKPVNEGNSCTSYMPQDFGDEEQINLANFCKVKPVPNECFPTPIPGKRTLRTPSSTTSMPVSISSESASSVPSVP